jgi:Tol biopolymer transport system component
VTDAVRFPQQVAPDKFDVKMLRWVSVSPDGKRVLYTALGKLYVRDLPAGAPRRVTTNANDLELYPAWSPDGSSIVYASFGDDSLGSIRTVGTNGGNGRRLTTRLGHYIEPRYSPDGKQVVYRRIGGDAMRGALYSRDQGVYVVSTSGGEPKRITGEGSDPRFTRAGDRVFLTSNEAGKPALVSVNLYGAERRVHITAENATQFAPSPDERYVAWIERFNAFVAPMPQTGKPVDAGAGTSEFPVRRISRDAGLYLHWSDDSKRVYWALGPSLFQRDLSGTFAFETEDTTSLRRTPEAAGTPVVHAVGFESDRNRAAHVALAAQ